ncbi:hypothetical protein J6590_011659 [Homalodisca vitripennis]|nr:hypothetical protein J6590_011659 [Homalodisca vitripennis]
MREIKAGRSVTTGEEDCFRNLINPPHPHKTGYRGSHFITRAAIKLVNLVILYATLGWRSSAALTVKLMYCKYSLEGGRIAFLAVGLFHIPSKGLPAGQGSARGVVSGGVVVARLHGNNMDDWIPWYYYNPPPSYFYQVPVIVLVAVIV